MMAALCVRLILAKEGELAFHLGTRCRNPTSSTIAFVGSRGLRCLEDLDPNDRTSLHRTLPAPKFRYCAALHLHSPIDVERRTSVARPEDAAHGGTEGVSIPCAGGERVSSAHPDA